MTIILHNEWTPLVSIAKTLAIIPSTDVHSENILLMNNGYNNIYYNLLSDIRTESYVLIF